MYYNSLNLDPDLMIQSILIDVLIISDPSKTPWTNTSLVGDPQNQNFSGKPPIFAAKSAEAFANAMQNMDLNYTYDYAVAIVK